MITCHCGIRNQSNNFDIYLLSYIGAAAFILSVTYAETPVAIFLPLQCTYNGPLSNTFSILIYSSDCYLETALCGWCLQTWTAYFLPFCTPINKVLAALFAFYRTALKFHSGFFNPWQVDNNKPGSPVYRKDFKVLKY